MATRPSVLFVDDQDGSDAVECLQSSDLTVDRVPGAEAVADRVGHGTYDCVVSRLEVPDRRGLTYLGAFDVHQVVRSVDADVPFVLFTDVENYDVIRRVSERDIFAFVPDRGDEASYDRLATVVDRAIGHLPARRRASQQTAINRTIRRVNEALVRAPTREQIEQAVVTVLADSSRFRATLVFEVDEANALVVPRAVGGVEGGRSAVGTRTAREADPLVTASTEDRTVIARREEAPGAFDGICERARLVCAMPLIYETDRFGVLAVYTDHADAFRTDERRAFEELARNVALAIDAAETRHTLRERTQALGRQNDRLEEFATVISHELRHPLQVAMGRLEIVADAIDDPDVDEEIRTIERNHAQIASLIEDLVALARENAREQTREPTSLEAIAREAREYVDPPRPDVIVNTTAVVRVDPHRLRHLFEVLYRQSVERAGPDVVIEVRSLEDGFELVTDADALPIDPGSERFEADLGSSTESRLSMRLVTNIVESHGWTLTTTPIDGQVSYAFEGIEFM
ncbi:MAG: histidine kinase dimerization/phospho-acceptor domain-containing protein [Halococcoides sp.]